MQPTTSATHDPSHDRSTRGAGYHSYLVRLWQTHPASAWRASAQCVQTGETVRFADLTALFAFLAAQTMGQTVESPPLTVQPRFPDDGDGTP